MRYASHLAAIGLALSTISASLGNENLPVDESPRAVVERRIAAVGRHDLDAIAALYAPNSVQTSPAFCADRVGPEGARRTYGDLFASFPTITADEPAYVVEGSRVAVEFLARARKPDGSMAFEVRLANFLTVENGRITRDDTYFDTKGRLCS